MKQQFDALIEHLLAGNIFLEEAIELLERGMIQGALERSQGRQTAASKRLSVPELVPPISLSRRARERSERIWPRG